MKHVQWKLSCSMWTDRQTDQYMSGWTDMLGQTDMTKLIVTLCKFVNVPKNSS